MADEDGLLPVGLALEGENDDDTRADAAALFGIDLGDGSAALIDVDADGGERGDGDYELQRLCSFGCWYR